MSSKFFLVATCFLFFVAAVLATKAQGLNLGVKEYGAKADGMTNDDIQQVPSGIKMSNDIGSIAKRWKKLSGKNNWEGLLEPLDVDLRRYLIQYGDKIQAVPDAFISYKGSKNIGLPRYTKRHLFSKVGLVNGNPYDYSVVKYLYASTKDCRSPQYPVNPRNVAGYSNWIGYVAVSSDAGSLVLGRRDIVVAIRGTIKDEEWYLKYYLTKLVAATEIFGDIKSSNDCPKLQEGRYVYYVTADPESTFNPTSLRDQVLSTVRELVNKYRDEEVSITVTGHSMGGAFVTIIATDIAYNGYNKPTAGLTNKIFPVTGFAFANSPVGDKSFAKTYSKIKNLHILRVSNLHDPNPDSPTEAEGYYHVGKELVVDSYQSPYLKSPNVTVHQLQVYLHAIAGTQGKAGGFEFEVERDIALLNKGVDALKDVYNITAKWWGEKNNNMVQLDSGTWSLILDREIDDDDGVQSASSSLIEMPGPYSYK